MLKAIKEFVESRITGPAEQDPAASEHALRLATAALLVEMTRQDDTIHEAERVAVAEALRNKFGLAHNEVDELYALAEAEVKEAIDYYQFTSLLKDHFTPAQKEKVVELLWQVAGADGHIDKYEEHMVRRIAELLYLTQTEYIRAKHKALGIE